MDHTNNISEQSESYFTFMYFLFVFSYSVGMPFILTLILIIAAPDATFFGVPVLSVLFMVCFGFLIFFGARPSADQLQMAEETGKELVLTPIGKEAFVFFVSNENSISHLSSEQIQDIYSGKITNWSEVGGKKERILAFQRPENSGSQTMMEYFMGDIPLKEPLEYEYQASMGGVIQEVADYQNSSASIGYSFRYYATIMNREASAENAGIKKIS